MSGSRVISCCLFVAGKRKGKKGKKEEKKKKGKDKKKDKWGKKKKDEVRKIICRSGQ
jgi:hypothetical protein